MFHSLCVPAGVWAFRRESDCSRCDWHCDLDPCRKVYGKKGLDWGMIAVDYLPNAKEPLKKNQIYSPRRWTKLHICRIPRMRSNTMNIGRLAAKRCTRIKSARSRQRYTLDSESAGARLKEEVEKEEIDKALNSALAGFWRGEVVPGSVPATRRWDARPPCGDAWN
ncbi:hypothetical protein RB195_010518 [Necator americanus]|uniref:Uncharacterized protein n=1 Tax=Necator americanus TaxID=51031 RepID=A0ABR1CZ30_NECAM